MSGFETPVSAGHHSSSCLTCGACCAFSREWPRFSTESDAELNRIPEQYVADDLSGMRCDGDRCAALTGSVGVFAACIIYDMRPHVCRACKPGDDECRTARISYGLEPLGCADRG